MKYGRQPQYFLKMEDVVSTQLDKIWNTTIFMIMEDDLKKKNERQPHFFLKIEYLIFFPKMEDIIFF